MIYFFGKGKKKTLTEASKAKYTYFIMLVAT